MLLTNFLEKRKSVRNFTDKSADAEILNKVKSIINNSEEENTFSLKMERSFQKD